jgi:solute carrier family 25 carnitine/acylcarnitine transporter 20/29
MLEYNIKEYIKGFLVGSTQTVIGHPFDTIKTNIQANKKVNILKLHRGIIFPLVSNSFINSVLFGSYDHFRNQSFNPMTSGMIAGIVISSIVTPFDKLKIEYQIDNSKRFNQIKYKKIYRGFGITCIRESIGSGIYFYSYYKLKQMQYFKGEMNIFLSGGIAGCLSWFLTYPFDVIKTRIQSDKYNSIKSSFKKGNLFKGLRICLLRSFIVNSIGFFIYEKIS